MAWGCIAGSEEGSKGEEARTAVVITDEAKAGRHTVEGQAAGRPLCLRPFLSCLHGVLEVFLAGCGHGQGAAVFFYGWNSSVLLFFSSVYF